MADEPSRARRFLAKAGGPLLALFSIGIAWAVAECVFAFLLSHPAWLRRLPPNVANHVRGYYLLFDRDLIQADPRFARYDPGLFYTLRPGVFRFRNREFDVEFQVNSAGLRDDEDSLRAPEAIALGDSFAMGWGVPQDQTFPERVAARTGLKVLNAGVSSYGTARELKLLERLDRSKARFLLLQYDDNDAWENATLERNQGILPIGTQERFEHTLQREGGRRRYYLGRHTWQIVRGLFGPPGDVLEEPIPSPQEQARLFVYALTARGDAWLEAIDLIVFALSPSGRNDDAFCRALREELRKHPPATARRIRVIDLAPRLRPSDWYDLDDHLRPSGHAIVADEIVKTIARIGVSP